MIPEDQTNTEIQLEQSSAGRHIKAATQSLYTSKP